MKRVCLIAIVILLPSSVLWAQETDPPSYELKRNSIGLGFGIPYGILGLNLDVNIVQNLNLSIGTGGTEKVGFGYSAGFKYFLSSIEEKLRPRVSAYYGINTVIETEYISSDGSQTETESFAGFSFGAGIQIMCGKSKRNGFDFDFIFTATRGNYKNDEGSYSDEPNRVSISLGYRHTF